MYKLIFDKKFYKAFERVQKVYRPLIEAKLQQISIEPFRAGKKLKAKEGRYSARVGIYRILYVPHGEKMYVIIYEINHRKDIYKEN